MCNLDQNSRRMNRVSVVLRRVFFLVYYFKKRRKKKEKEEKDAIKTNNLNNIE